MTHRTKNTSSLNKITFAPTNKVAKYHDEMKDLVEKLFGYDIDGIFVSNKSSLYDFLDVANDVKTIKDIVKKINKIYGIDITSIKDKSIIDIIEFMLKKDKFCFNKKVSFL